MSEHKMAFIIITSSQDNCEDILCSNVFDYVCGAVEFKDGNVILMKYQNVCAMRKSSCQLKSIADTVKASDSLCNIEKKVYMESGRRVTDYSIVGAHQTCNHSCPTYCVDTYEPACAQIWKPRMESYSYRPMINHCHIDLFSCTTGLNVTIHPLGKCYKNPSGLLFMTQVAAMKSLKLLDDSAMREQIHKYINGDYRRSKKRLRDIIADEKYLGDISTIPIE